jgi:hypothetical protein
LPRHRTTGLDDEQFAELARLVALQLPGPWDKPTGRPRALRFLDAVAVTCAYLRQNIVEEVLGEMFGVSQATVSRVVSDLTGLVNAALDAFIPDAEEAAAAVRGRVCLLDGSLSPCWSWARRPDLYSGKHKTTGHNFQVISDLVGNVLAVSEPVPGKCHDMAALKATAFDLLLSVAGGVIGDKGYQGAGYLTPVKKPQGGELLMREMEFNNELSGLRAPVERAVANLKTWRILHTDYRRPIETYRSSFNAAIGLYFFELSFA